MAVARKRPRRDCWPPVSGVKVDEREGASPASNSTIGKCAACRCASRSVRRMWPKARSCWRGATGPARKANRSCRRTACQPRWPALLEDIQKALLDRALRIPRCQHARRQDLRRVQGGRREGLCPFVLVRQRRVRGEDQGRNQGHDALHSPGRLHRQRRVRVLRQAGDGKRDFRSRVLTFLKKETRLAWLHPARRDSRSFASGLLR